MNEDEAIEAIKYRCEQRLGHLGTCHVSVRDCGTAVGVGLELHEKHDVYRHAVGGDIWDADPYSNPILFADTCCDRLIEFFTEKSQNVASIDTSLPS